MGDDTKDENAKQISFTIEQDQTGASMPSITRLLNRKSLGSSRKPPAPPTQPSAPLPSTPSKLPSPPSFSPPPAKKPDVPLLTPKKFSDLQTADTQPQLAPPSAVAYAPAPPPHLAPPLPAEAIDTPIKLDLNDENLVQDQIDPMTAIHLQLAEEPNPFDLDEKTIIPQGDQPDPMREVTGVSDGNDQSPPQISLEISESSAPQAFEIEGNNPSVPFSISIGVDSVPAIETSGVPEPERAEPKPDTEPEPQPEPTKPPVAQLLKIQPHRRKSTEPVKKLIIWQPESLKNGFDPLGRSIVLLMQRGGMSALFLAISAPPPGSPVPHFLATATVMPEDKLNIWTGLKWDPTVVPEMWNQFIKSGMVELSPPGTRTTLSSNRNIVRSAFGILNSEWLLLLRVGPASACRGILTVISKASLQTQLADVLQIISTLPTLPSASPTSSR